MPTATGAADDHEPRLTEEQLEALRRAFANPPMLQSIRQVENTLSVLSKQISSTYFTGITPALELWRVQQQQLAKSITPIVIAPVQMQRIMAPLVEQAARIQREMASSLRVPVLAKPLVQTRIPGMVVSSAFTETLHRIREMAAVSLTMPTEEGLNRLSELVETGEIDDETLESAEQGIAANVELSAAIDDAAEVLSVNKPFISRRRARQIIVFWVWLMYSGALFAVAVLTTPAVAAIPGSIGLASAPAAAKAVSLKILPPKDDEAHDTED